MDIIGLSLKEIKQLLKERKVTSQEVTKAVIAQIKATSELNSVITICEDEALAQAKTADEAIASGKEGLLLGIPVALSDNISTKDIKTTCASKIMDNYVSPYDATVVTKLKEAGAVIVAKTNMDEFGIGLTGETSIYGATKNPTDKNLLAGGGCSGSAAAVVANQCYGALGADTLGGVRQPAAMVGAVAMKPTYSLVSRYGVVGLASSFDQVGVFSKTVEDNGILLQAIYGKDPMDATSSEVVENYEDVDVAIKGKVIGMPKEYFTDEVSEQVKAKVNEIVEKCKAAGAQIKEVSIPYFDSIQAVGDILSSAEASSALARFDGIKYGRSIQAPDYNEIYYESRSALMGEKVQQEIMFGNYVLSSKHYQECFVKAGKVRTLIIEGMKEIFKQCDVIVGATSPITAKDLKNAGAEQSLEKYTALANVVGMPALTMPIGKDDAGLPISIQIMGDMFKEKTILGVARYIEEVR